MSGTLMEEVRNLGRMGVSLDDRIAAGEMAGEVGRVHRSVFGDKDRFFVNFVYPGQLPLGSFITHDAMADVYMVYVNGLSRYLKDAAAKEVYLALDQGSKLEPTPVVADRRWIMTMRAVYVVRKRLQHTGGVKKFIRPLTMRLPSDKALNMSWEFCEKARRDLEERCLEKGIPGDFVEAILNRDDFDAMVVGMYVSSLIWGKSLEESENVLRQLVRV